MRDLGASVPIRTIYEVGIVLLRTNTNGIYQEVPLVPGYLSVVTEDIAVEMMPMNASLQVDLGL